MLHPIDREKYPESPIDGFSELGVDSIDDAEKALSSPVGQETYDDVANFVEHAAVTDITEIKKR